MTVTTSAISFVDRIRRKTYSGHEERVGFRTAWAWHVLQDAICCSKKHLRVFGLDAEKAAELVTAYTVTTVAPKEIAVLQVARSELIPSLRRL
jgi:hypothetical protein